MKSNITCTSKNGRSTGYLPEQSENHDSASRGTRLFVANESASDRAERLAVIARLSKIYSTEMIAATYGVSE